MNRQESSSSESGLLAQAVRLMNTPVFGSAAQPTEESEAARLSRARKQALNEMVERKRNNDLVRLREFEQLRALRVRQIQRGQQSGDFAQNPSQLNSTTSRERAETLRKIDAIEAQMSHQWWKKTGAAATTTQTEVAEQQAAGQLAPASAAIAAALAAARDKSRRAGSDFTVTMPASALAGSPAPPVASPPPTAPASSPCPAAPPSFAPTAPASLAAPASSPCPAAAPPSFAPTAPASLAAPASSPRPAAAPPSFAPTAPAPPAALAASSPPPAVPVASAAVSTTGLASQWEQEQESLVHDLELEEAAICFANGDWVGAQDSLKTIWAQRRQGGAGVSPQQRHDIWMMLFDLYRATGQRESFDTLALDYATHFDRSAPLWFSLPGQLGQQEVLLSGQSAPVVRHELNWSAQPQLTQQSVAALRSFLKRAAPPLKLDWTRITGMQVAAVSDLADLFEYYAEQKVELQFLGVSALQAVLQAYTQSDDQGADPQWWRLRMAALRLMNQPEEFEMVALDYCVTYEISPPSWVPPQCSYSGDGEVQANAPQANANEPDSDLFMSRFSLSKLADAGDTVPAALAAAGTGATLTGYLEGDAMQQLEALMRPGNPLTVDCSRLIRIDFVAAGSVLNWAAAVQAEGRVVRFINLHRLAAVFFYVVGINECAQVIVRND